MLTETTKTVKTARRFLRATGLFCVNGDIQTPGTIIEVSAIESSDLTSRGLAVHATDAEVAAAGDAIVVAPVRENATWVNA